MSGTVKWIGNAYATYDIWTITVANTWAAGDVGNVTALGITLAVTVGTAAATTDVATAIAAAFNSTTLGALYSVAPTLGGQSVPAFTELAATVVGSTVVLTARTAGLKTPTFTVSETTAGSGTLAIAHTATATGPNDWANSLNWDTLAVPANGDDVVIDRAIPILDGFAQSAVTLASLKITANFDSTCQIGLEQRNVVGYEEWRASELAIGATVFESASGSPLIRINFGAVQTTAKVISTGVSADARPACQLRGTHVSNLIEVIDLPSNSVTTDFGWAPNGETAVAATINQSGGNVNVGQNVTLGVFDQIGGDAEIHCGGTTLTSWGTTTHFSGAWTNVTVNGGTLYDASESNYSTLTINNGATFNSDEAVGSKTVSTFTNNGGTVVNNANRLGAKVPSGTTIVPVR